MPSTEWGRRERSQSRTSESECASWEESGIQTRVRPGGTGLQSWHLVGRGRGIRNLKSSSLHDKLEASPGYLRPCLKKAKPKQRKGTTEMLGEDQEWLPRGAVCSRIEGREGAGVRELVALGRWTLVGFGVGWLSGIVWGQSASLYYPETRSWVKWFFP